MRKVFFWAVLLLGLFLLIGTIVTVLSTTAKLLPQITIASIPYLLVGIVLDFITNPAGWLGIVLLVWAFFLTTRGEVSIFKTKVKNVIKKLNIGVNPDNSIHLTYKPNIFYNTPKQYPQDIQDIIDSKMRNLKKEIIEEITGDLQQYDLSYEFAKNMPPDEFAQSVVNASGIAVSEHIFSEAIKATLVKNNEKRNQENRDEIANYIIGLKNKLWKNIPPKLKPIFAIGYILGVIILVAVVSTLATKVIDSDKPIEPKSAPKPQEIKHSLKNGGFESGLDYWEVVTKRQSLSASSDTTITFYQGYLYNISTSIRRSGQKSLYINNENTKAISNETGNKFMIKQLISGLRPNAQYRLTYYVKGSLKSQDSLWFKLSSPSWTAYHGDRYYTDSDENYSDWKSQSSVINTGDWTEAYLWLVSEDVCKLHLDDITFVEITE